jgi:peptidoglycan hydrolase CwlO-like protein
MSDVVIAGLLSLIGTLSGTFGGIVVANKLTTYRLEQLEKKVDKHNSVIDRMYRAEKRLDVLDEKVSETNRHVNALEDK